MLRLALVVFLIACGGSSSTGPATPTGRRAIARKAASFVTKARPAATSLEHQLVAAGHSLEPAMDCVAQGFVAARGTPEAQRAYSHELSLACGVPYYVLTAAIVDDDAAVLAKLDEIDGKRSSPLKFAIGLAVAGSSRAVVIARKGVELEAVERTGTKTTIRGQALVLVPSGAVYVSSAQGVTSKKIMYDNGRFDITVDAPADALLEITLLDNQNLTGPLFRVEQGKGSQLFPLDGTPLDRVNAARGSLGMKPLVPVLDGPGECDPIAPQVGDIDVTDRARCIDLWIEDDELGDEIAYRPELQSFVLERDFAVFETGKLAGGGISLRLLRRFEALPPDAARERMLDLLRKRWPKLAVRPLPRGVLDTILKTWAADLDAHEDANKYKPEIDKVSLQWSNRTPYTMLVVARDLHTASTYAEPDVLPIAADAAVLQLRAADGAMVNFVAVVLELP